MRKSAHLVSFNGLIFFASSLSSPIRSRASVLCMRWCRQPGLSFPLSAKTHLGETDADVLKRLMSCVSMVLDWAKVLTV